MLQERKVVAINNKPVMGSKKTKNKKNLLVLYTRQTLYQIMWERTSF